MKINISTSSSSSEGEIKKGVRVVVNAGPVRPNDYYLATISRVNKNSWSLLFDDGTKGVTARIFGLGINRKMKRSFTRRDLSKYSVQSKVILKTKKRKTSPTKRVMDEAVNSLVKKQRKDKDFEQDMFDMLKQAESIPMLREQNS